MSTINEKYKMIYLTTPFCGVCQTAKPMMTMLAETLNITLEEMDANKNESVLIDNQVRSVPAIIIYSRNEEKIIYKNDTISDLVTMYDEIIPLIKK